MCAKLIPLSDCALSSDAQRSIAVHQGAIIDSKDFYSDVAALSSTLLSLSAERFALYYEQAYPFSVMFFALLHSDKEVWIAANNKALTADQLSEQGCVLLGDWQGRECVVSANNSDPATLKALDSAQPRITVFTSGSTGQAKTIRKSLQQFQTEIETLEAYWGQHLGEAEVLATVSHQHIYGLLFRVLWPLAAGRCFHSEMYLSPEPLLKQANLKNACWVSSPAQLKRLDELTAWQGLRPLKLIFSSGGVLPLETAEAVYKNCGHKIVEIYGSTETGGIAWRRSVADPAWRLFDGLQLRPDSEQGCYLSSPYLPDQQPYRLDDRIELLEANRFNLLGRIDRIVKVEEKRVSLDEMEQRLNASNWVQQSYTLFLTGKRDKIAAVLVLTETGKDYLQQNGRSNLIKQLRKQLMQSFETVVLPRQWLLMSALPLTAQGKIDQALLRQIFSLNHERLPQIQQCDVQPENVELQIKVPEKLIYFTGHFPGQPILPGVTQLAWVEYLGKTFFNISLPFLHMEVIKFKKIIRPGDMLQMTLSWKDNKSKLYFELKTLTESHSSGRMVYGEA